ncbi:hypothetical protein L208DRAFT_1415679 [Tricholoma matsutake]|nr:hypothetical protein L208DRAFT_1415679 [Tricholoma matsutake 945]
MLSLSSSSHSSFDSVFDHQRSRSSSPSSVGSSCHGLADIPPSYRPKTCLYVPKIQPDALKAIFERCAEGGSLGLYLPAGSFQSALHFADWDKQSVPVKGGTQAELFVSSFPEQKMYDSESRDLIITTTPKIAEHLLLISLASLRANISVFVNSGDYIFYVLEKPAFVFPPLSASPSFSTSATPGNIITKGNVPTPEEWRTLWAAWDLVTMKMIPKEMLHKKPIDLRHKCLFYIGHIPTFLDMLLHKAIGGGPSEPKHFWSIFERGIDPHVDDPDYCHNHSDVPEADEDWPALESIITFRDRVRARLMQLYDDLQTGKRPFTRNIARTLVMTLEHEGFHVETLLYMLIQRAGTGTLPPPGFLSPSWELLLQQWNSIPAPSNTTVTLGPVAVTLGHADCEGEDKLEGIAEDIDGHIFGWDNESPERKVDVGVFRVDWRPVSNCEFETFWRAEGAGKLGMPGSWVEEDGEIKVRTMYGPVSMDIARHWPVLTSYDHLLMYAKSKGGRLPTEPELRLFLDTYDVGFEGGANFGFRNWHPVPATTGLEEYAGKGSNGGVWEWTSTLFDTHEGLSPTNLFTGYSTDFFDSKHQVVLGASYATIPRLATRRTVRNFYQHNYPYPWVGGRVAYDV